MFSHLLTKFDPQMGVVQGKRRKPVVLRSKAHGPVFPNLNNSIPAMNPIHRPPALEEPTAASQRPTIWHTCCPSCMRCKRKGVESPRKCQSSAGSVTSSSPSHRSSIASTSSRASLPNAYAMVTTSFAESKSSAVRDWDAGRCKRQYKSKSLDRTSVVAAYFNEELVRHMASSRKCPKVA